MDTRTGTLRWEATLAARDGSAGSGNVLADLIGAAPTRVNGHTTDRAHDVAAEANAQLRVKGRGPLRGPYSPKYGQD